MSHHIENAVDISTPNGNSPQEVRRSIQEIIAYLRAVGPIPNVLDGGTAIDSYAGKWVVGEYDGTGSGPRDIIVTDEHWEVMWGEAVREDQQSSHGIVWRLHSGSTTVIRYSASNPNVDITYINLTTTPNVLQVDGVLNTSAKNYHYRVMMRFVG